MAIGMLWNGIDESLHIWHRNKHSRGYLSMTSSQSTSVSKNLNKTLQLSNLSSPVMHFYSRACFRNWPPHQTIYWRIWDLSSIYARLVISGNGYELGHNNSQVERAWEYQYPIGVLSMTTIVKYIRICQMHGDRWNEYNDAENIWC